MVKKILTTTSVFDLPYAVIWRVQLANGFLVAIVLLLLQPFQLHRSSFNDLLVVSLLSGASVFCVGSLIFWYVRGWLTKTEVRRKFYILIESATAISIITAITLIVFFYRVMTNKVPISANILLSFFYYSIVLTPLLVATLRTTLVVRELTIIALSRDAMVATGKVTSTKPKVIEFNQHQAEKPLKFLLSDFVYANADGNYVELHLLDNKTVKTLLLRSTLKAFSQVLLEYPVCIQCHRSYWVNIEHVTRLVKHNNSARLLLLDEQLAIPVSRSVIKTLTQRIEDVSR